MSDAIFDFAPHLPRLDRYAQSLTRNRAHADDLVQDTMIRALAKAHLFVQNTNLRGWLVTIMHNEHINTARRFFRDPMTVPEDGFDTIGYDETQTAPIELCEILHAIDQLPAEQRQALLLRSVQGLRYEEIAATLGLPMGTVQSRISRARKRLRAMIANRTRGSDLRSNRLLARRKQSVSTSEFRRWSAWQSPIRAKIPMRDVAMVEAPVVTRSRALPGSK